MVQHILSYINTKKPTPKTQCSKAAEHQKQTILKKQLERKERLLIKKW
jgi:hypothetical protein